MTSHHSADRGVRACARRLAVSPAAIRRAAAEGRIATDADGRIKPEAEVQGATSGPKVSRTLAAARRRKLRAAVQLLDDELVALRANAVTAVDLRSRWLAACREVAGEVERMLTVEVPRTSPGAAFAVLQDQVDALLARLMDCLPASLEEEAGPKRPDLARMSTIKLATLKADRQAEKLELQCSLVRGDLIKLDRVVVGLEDRIGRCRALLLGIPSRASPIFEMSEVRGRQVLADDMVHALSELAGHGVEVGDYLPVELVEAGRAAASRKSK